MYIDRKRKGPEKDALDEVEEEEKRTRRIAIHVYYVRAATAMNLLVSDVNVQSRYDKTTVSEEFLRLV
jgi:hypothetical protein